MTDLAAHLRGRSRLMPKGMKKIEIWLVGQAAMSRIMVPMNRGLLRSKRLRVKGSLLDNLFLRVVLGSGVFIGAFWGFNLS